MWRGRWVKLEGEEGVGCERLRTLLQEEHGKIAAIGTLRQWFRRVQAGLVKKRRDSKCHMTAWSSNPNARMNTKSKRWRPNALKTKRCSRLFQGILVQDAVASNACFGDGRSSYYGLGGALRCMPRRRCPDNAALTML